MTRSCEGDLISKASGLEGLPGPIPPMRKSYGGDPMSKAHQDSRAPPDLLERLPPNQNLSVLLFYAFLHSSHINRGLSPTPFLLKELT